jgi:hypothetical protein
MLAERRIGHERHTEPVRRVGRVHEDLVAAHRREAGSVGQTGGMPATRVRRRDDRGEHRGMAADGGEQLFGRAVRPHAQVHRGQFDAAGTGPVSGDRSGRSFRTA